MMRKRRHAKTVWFDSHCHLYELDEGDGAAAVLGRARVADVEGVVVLGTNPETSAAAIALAQRNEGVWAGVAYHPSDVKDWTNPWLDRIEVLAAEPSVVAIGETGLDFYWDRSYVDAQESAFAAHIGLAKKLEKTLVVHTRDSMDRVLELLEAHGPPEHLLFHCWGGDSGQLLRALHMGGYVSFAGNVTYKSAEDLREACRLVPDDRLLIETDSPYLAPVPHRGKPNEPAFVADVGTSVATTRGVDAETIAAQTTANAKTLFGL
jgi:TatD DNase family protein